MMSGVLVGGRVAAQHLATVLAKTKMHPSTIGFNAFFTMKDGVIGFGNQCFCGHGLEMFAGHRAFRVEGFEWRQLL
jgi:hypothetical protein